MLANQYRPKPYPGKATIFYSNDAKTDNGLARYLTGDLEEHRIKTDHSGFKGDAAVINEWVEILNHSLREVCRRRVGRVSSG